MKSSLLKGLVLLFVMSGSLSAQTTSGRNAGGRLLLRENWRIQSSSALQAEGGALSTPGYKTTGWYAATVPSTVVGALVEDKVYPDPFYGMNLRLMPGCSYPIGHNFANLPMPDDSPYNKPWWYRTEFQVPAADRGQRLWLHFDGINYAANVWLNGHKIADAGEVAGAFRRYEFDVTDAARVGRNALAVEVSAPKPDDLAL